jgi:tetratricopeptide (TPR) repeat protein
MDTRQVVARFEAERQALALMDHPNIAHIHDGGTTTTGRPYFVMELVRGIPITEYCDQSHLAVPARLELFIRVCQAVQHAHTKGVIHRDLKPSNVLVTLHDLAPVPKVIDFGVAKALGRRLTDKTLFTAFAQMVGTPTYMSPEQAQLSGLDVDTRSDIYSLGVLLYELLAGTTPFDGERLRTVGYDEMRRIIREEEPARPSSRVTTLDQAAATVSVNRRTDPRRLSRLLRGELDWVVMKCLEKDRTRRYETVDALAKDVDQYLTDEPVQACPPSVAYRFRKLVRRNKRTVWAVGVVVLALIGGIIGTSWQAIRADKLRHVATTQEGIANDNLIKARTQTLRAEDNFQKVLAAVDEWLKPAIDENTPGHVKQELYKIPEVVELTRVPLDRALKFFEDFVAQKGTDPDTRLERAWAYLQIGRIRERLSEVGIEAEKPADGAKRREEHYAKGVQAVRESLVLLNSLVEESPDEARFRVDLARVYSALGGMLNKHSVSLRQQAPQVADQKLNEAVNVYVVARGICAQLSRDTLGREQRYQLALTYREVAAGLALRGPQRGDETMAAERDSIALLEKLVAEFPDDPSKAISLAEGQRRLAYLLKTAKRMPEAESCWRAAIAVMEKAVADCPNEPKCLEELARCHWPIAVRSRPGSGGR